MVALVVVVGEVSRNRRALAWRGIGLEACADGCGLRLLRTQVSEVVVVDVEDTRTRVHQRLYRVSFALSLSSLALA